jgi:hypothetical protein
MSNIDRTSVFNSRPFDVHRWSNYPEVESVVIPLWQRFSAEQSDKSSGRRGRPTNRIKRDNMKVLLLDLYVCWCEDPYQYIGISSNQNHWSRGRYKALHLSKTILDVLKWLVSNGYIDKRKHYYNKDGGKPSRMARYRASELLQSIFKKALFGLEHITTHENTECIILKNVKAEDNESIEYQDTNHTIEMRKRLIAYNKLLSHCHIDIHSLTEPFLEIEINKGSGLGKFNRLPIGQHNKFVRRIFSRGSWEMHGRFYGGWWQQIGRELRRGIFINGNPTVEVDFKAQHISILNAKLGAEVVYDPYTVNDDLFPEFDRSLVRGWCKSLVLTALNARDRSSAYNAFRSGSKKGSPEKRLKNSDLDRLLDAFIEKNPHLRDLLCSDQGIKLMFIDGLIAADIINYLTEKNIPVLTIHDSFIVQRQHFAELRIAMNKAALNHCRRCLIAEQDGIDIDYSKEINWPIINERAVNKLPQYKPCKQYLERFKRFCELTGVVAVRNNNGRGLMARPVLSLSSRP